VAAGKRNEMEMKQPELKINRTGSQYLLVYYSQELNDFDYRIDQALDALGLEDQRLPIIALPVGISNDHKGMGRGINICNSGYIIER